MLTSLALIFLVGLAMASICQKNKASPHYWYVDYGDYFRNSIFADCFRRMAEKYYLYFGTSCSYEYGLYVTVKKCCFGVGSSF